MAGFGIHLGGTSMCIAIGQNGRTEVMANPSGDRVTPAMVRYMENEEVVGTPAKQGSVRHAAVTAVRARCLVSEADRGEALVERYCPVEEGRGFVVRREGGKEEVHAPEEVLTTLFKHLHHMAQGQVGSDQTQYDAVLAVPPYFSRTERDVLRAAACAAGFQVRQLIAEPVAALLAHGVGQSADAPASQVILVLRAGGVSSDATVVRCTGGLYSQLETLHRPGLGGDALTDLLAEYLANECYSRWKIHPRESKRALDKLRAAAESAKHALSTVHSAQCHVESLLDGVDFSCSVSRPRWEGLLTAPLQPWVQLAREAVAAAGVDAVDQLVLCGGTARIPRLRELLTVEFPAARLLGGQNLDEVLAEGAARQAALLAESDGEQPADPEPRTVAVTSRPLHLSFGTQQYQAVPAGTPVPSVRTVEHVTAAGATPAPLVVELAEGDVTDPERRPLARFTLPETSEGTRLLATLVLRREHGLRLRLANGDSGAALVADVPVS